MGPGYTLDQDFNRPAGFLAPEQARRQHTGIVEHEQVTRPQQIGQFTKLAIDHGLAGHVELKQTTGRALGKRLLGNQLGRQIEMEIRFFQGPGTSKRARIVADARNLMTGHCESVVCGQARGRELLCRAG